MVKKCSGYGQQQSGGGRRGGNREREENAEGGDSAEGRKDRGQEKAARGPVEGERRAGMVEEQ